MGVSSLTEIYNSALLKCGAEPILSTSDDSTRARLINACATRVRQDLIRAHPWNFAKVMIQLAPTVTVPLFDWTYEFTLPTNCLRVIKLDTPNPTEPWERMGNEIYTNFTPVNIKYVRDVTDPTIFDDNFVEVLAWAYANEIIFSLTQVASTRESIFAGYQKALAQARSFNAQESSTPRVIADDWLNRRRS